MTLITLGPEGTFSHDLASMISDSVQLVSSIERVFKEVIRTNTSGLVPLENSEAGGVTATLDGLSQYPVFISLDAYLPIHHNLASNCPVGMIERLYAHPQSHDQCSRMVEELNVPVIHTPSNAASAIEAKNHPHSAAIVSESLSIRYDLPIMKKNVENNPSNVTRFIVIESSPGTLTPPEKCSIIIDPQENRAGLLYDLLIPFKRENVNLTRIESRPSKRKMGSYLFFLDFTCENDWKMALHNITNLTTVKHLGCYASWKGEKCR